MCALERPSRCAAYGVAPQDEGLGTVERHQKYPSRFFFSIEADSSESISRP